MKKIPVGATIAHAYKFAFQNFLSVLSVIWLGWVVMILPNIWLQQTRADMTRSAMQGGNIFGPHAFLLLLLFVLNFALMAMQMLGVTELALGKPMPSRWYYFSLRRPVWRLLGSILILLVSFIVMAIVATVVAALVNLPFRAAGDLTPHIVTFLGAAALLVAYLYIVVRLAFLLAPIVANNDPGTALARSWRLSKGNAWRMIVVTVAGVAPFLIIEGAFVIDFIFQGMPHMPPHPTADDIAAYRIATQAHTQMAVQQIYRLWYVIYPVAAVLTVLFFGVSAGAQAFAYRAITESDPVPGDALPE